jgi:CRP/FNR family transcriptional regulator, cyclic AMP receptor protein
LDLPRRVAKVLLSQPKAGNGMIQPKISQEQLAHPAGGTRQSVNAALCSLERRGWIETRDRALAINQAAALRQFAGA